MEIKIEGDPGTGNTYNEVKQEFHIGHVENLNPNATTVNNYYGTRAKGDTPAAAPTPPPPSEAARAEILAYVDRLRCDLRDEWKSKYRHLWEDILDITVVKSHIYNPGKQQGTNFNRNLLANIIHHLGTRQVFRDYNASRLASHLEGTPEHSIRSALGSEPPQEITSRLTRYFDENIAPKMNICS